ncbi:hypothetical protein QF037_008863 [Streptomyces canus]|uniref:hypothetical protein n=1 Tax=Streptomyces canus TaxID=58343 RepID=UPI00277D766D|nr:hypothetical protein [Streptomyces canus]MDQ0604518.1 hypothetical protein [Streptomyces canus]
MPSSTVHPACSGLRPARWTPLSVLRGMINPAIDARLADDLKVRALLGKLEDRGVR